VLLIGVAVLHLAKGLDFEEGTVALAMAADTVRAAAACPAVAAVVVVAVIGVAGVFLAGSRGTPPAAGGAVARRTSNRPPYS